ncbi:PaaX family transcriptional regulator C-terminal domain-containing protein [Streptomyces sp. NBC_01408]|uniref:PaaX family transcriptional regulator C-terminal domain-containing protein n=1 Tax=Streptomyces sp. NBC_01408 TaxID=2903855 RepID=UPI002258D3F5|nr:PaaX family transcriptional regulator C-terminal domain-containing protein [Streptomyces sp. NBC_01408]MCX4692326.1 transcriptional regulator [Streptomyces sp. NBC_01408]
MSGTSPADGAGPADGTSPAGAGPAAPAVPTRMVVHALVREDGTVDGAELYEVAGLLGMTDQQVRLCVKRLVAEGRFGLEGRGRRSVLRLTGTGAGAGAVAGAGPELAALVPEVGFVRHAYRQDRGLEPWDGVWHAFAFAVPESARAARDALRDALTGLGAAPVQGGLYVTPNAIGPYVRARAAELGVERALTCLSTRDLAVGGITDPVALAARLWPLPEIADRYEALRALAASAAEPWGGDTPEGPRRTSAQPGPHVRSGTSVREPRRSSGGAPPHTDHAQAPAGATTPPCAPNPAKPPAGATATAQAIALAAALSDAMVPDPLLPPELLPQPWPGTVARAAAARAWARLRETAPAGGPRLFRLYGDALTGLGPGGL